MLYIIVSNFSAVVGLYILVMTQFQESGNRIMALSLQMCIVDLK